MSWLFALLLVARIQPEVERQMELDRFVHNIHYATGWEEAAPDRWQEYLRSLQSGGLGPQSGLEQAQLSYLLERWETDLQELSVALASPPYHCQIPN
jgi:hypothetical protein